MRILFKSNDLIPYASLLNSILFIIYESQHCHEILDIESNKFETSLSSQSGLLLINF